MHCQSLKIKPNYLGTTLLKSNNTNHNDVWWFPNDSFMGRGDLEEMGWKIKKTRCPLSIGEELSYGDCVKLKRQQPHLIRCKPEEAQLPPFKGKLKFINFFL